MRLTLSALIIHAATAGLVLTLAAPALAGDAIEILADSHEQPAKAEKTPAKADVAPTAAKRTAPAAPATGSTTQISPTVSREWVEKLSGARKEYLAASEKLDEINTEYARALYKAGEPSKVPAGIAASQKQAQSVYNAKRRVIPQMIEDARAAGVDDHVLDLYARSTGLDE
jgi:hypothetical protein